MNVLDLFSGIGGFSLGLERAGMRTVAFCEIDPFCRAVLRKHWPHVPIYEDVRSLTAGRLAADGISVDGICGGFPCQELSVAGIWNTDGVGLEGDRSGLWKEYSRIIGELRPRFVIVENVPGLLNNGFGRVLGELAAHGYDAEWHCIPACNIGAPHIRDRVWVVAYPKQEQRVRPILNADNVAKEIWLGATEQSEAWVRSEMGRTGGSIPSQWLDEPDPMRMADGVSDWPYRLGAVGNAVIPQIPEIIGRAIMQTHQQEQT